MQFDHDGNYLSFFKKYKSMKRVSCTTTIVNERLIGFNEKKKSFLASLANDLDFKIFSEKRRDLNLE